MRSTRTFAEADLAKIWVDIATSDIDIADQTIEDLRTLAQKRAEQPLMGRERPEFGKQVGVFPLKQLVLIYRHRPAAHRVDIARVVHGARDLTAVEFFKLKHRKSLNLCS